MLKSSARAAIRLRGVRHNNLKHFDLDLPLNHLIVVTGLSGSGKSSLAFDTLFAEGQRRYIETFSPYARQFFDRMDKPQVDSIEGIPPAIAIEQRNAVRTTRSTVGTLTEICDYMKLLWPHISQLFCRQCGQPVRQESPQSIWDVLLAEAQAGKPGGEDGARTPGSPAGERLITFDLPLTEKLSLEECLTLIAKQGYQRLLTDEGILRLEEFARDGREPAGRTVSSLMVIQDRIELAAGNRARFVEACEQAYHFGKGKLTVWRLSGGAGAVEPRRFSAGLHCATCDLEYREPTPALFSFNHPVGACPACRGFGRIISIDYALALPDRTKTLAEGVVRPWQSGVSAECQTDLLRACRQHRVPIDVPFEKLPKKWQDFVIEGEPGYGSDPAHEWPHAWYGLKGYFRWLESKAYKMHVRVLLSRYRAYTPCPACGGRRLQPDALLYRVPAEVGGRALTLADFYQMPIRDAGRFIERLAGGDRSRPGDPLAIALGEVRSRLGYLNEVGLGYLSLDRPTRSLSGGETERVNLTACLGTRLVNTLFVLDEPSVGLHARDTERLVRILEQLRSAGNTVVVVEHEASVMQAADQIVDLGPGHGAGGGQVVFQGSYAEILRAPNSLTGQYLSGRRKIEIPTRRPVVDGGLASDAAFRPNRSRVDPLVLNDADWQAPRSSAGAWLRISHATRHNLKDVEVGIPLGRLVCVTGVSGSGKTTLVRELLWPALAAKLKADAAPVKASDRMADEDGDDDGNGSESGQLEASAGRAPLRVEGAEHLRKVVLVDQTILGKTPRSNPAVYIGAFDDIRELFAQSELARQRGLNASAFSFNSTQGQCERCRGAGFEKIEMQFLSDVFVRCPDCNGRRYRPHILEIKLRPQTPAPASPGARGVARARAPRRSPSQPGLSIADLLESTVDEAVDFLGRFPDARPARRARESLGLLQEVGLGYLRLGQPINTLSGGESQRLKLVRHLAEGVVATVPAPARAGADRTPHRSPVEPPVSPTLFLFDEPTTGLHFEDVRVLLRVFQKLVDAGHSVLIIEHNLDVIKSADWIIDLGPEAGDEGGRVVAEGTPEAIAACSASHTGAALRRSAGL